MPRARPGLQILVVEAERALAEALAVGIEAQGCEAAVVPSGLAALVVIGEHAPDAVFLDSGLPDLDTTEVLRRIRTTHPGLPVVLVSGNGVERDHTDADTERLGVVGILPKSPILAGLSEALATP